MTEIVFQHHAPVIATREQIRHLLDMGWISREAPTSDGLHWYSVDPMCVDEVRAYLFPGRGL